MPLPGCPYVGKVAHPSDVLGSSYRKGGGGGHNSPSKGVKRGQRGYITPTISTGVCWDHKLPPPPPRGRYVMARSGLDDGLQGPRGVPMCRVPQVDADEWMYQISADTDKADPLAAWKRCWECLGDEKAAAAEVVGRYGPALEHLAEFINAQEALDRTAIWMEKAIRHRHSQPTDFPAEPFMSGHQPVLIHYSLADMGHSHGALLTARSSCSANSRSSSHVPLHASGGRAGIVPRGSRHRQSLGRESSMKPTSSMRLQVCGCRPCPPSNPLARPRG